MQRFSAWTVLTIGPVVPKREAMPDHGALIQEVATRFYGGSCGVEWVPSDEADVFRPRPVKWCMNDHRVIHGYQLASARLRISSSSGIIIACAALSDSTPM